MAARPFTPKYLRLWLSLPMKLCVFGCICIYIHTGRERADDDGTNERCGGKGGSKPFIHQPKGSTRAPACVGCFINPPPPPPSHANDSPRDAGGGGVEEDGVGVDGRHGAHALVHDGVPHVDAWGIGFGWVGRGVVMTMGQMFRCEERRVGQRHTQGPSPTHWFYLTHTPTPTTHARVPVSARRMTSTSTSYIPSLARWSECPSSARIRSRWICWCVGGGGGQGGRRVRV